MKVLFYNHTGQVSGAERVMLMILSGLDRNRVQTSVICPKEGGLAKYAEQVGAQVENTDLLEARFTWRPDYFLRYLRSFYKVIFALRRRVISAHPDLIHANTIRAGLVATTATIGTSIPVIWHLHDMLPHHPLSTAIRWYAALSPRTKLLAISHAVARRFQGRMLRLLNLCRKIQVIHNGIDLTRFEVGVDEDRKFRRSLNLSSDNFVIGIVGQVTPRKGQLELIRAFAEVAGQIPCAALVIVGAPLFNDDHEYLLKLKSAAEELNITGRVIFTGARSDVPAVMRGLDLLVLNSKVEPLGLVVQEAMASGTPVLATAVDGVPELVTHMVTGWLTPAADGKRLAASLVTLARDAELRRRLADNARLNLAPEFSSEKYLNLIENYYRQVHTPSKPKTARSLFAEN